MVLGVGPLGTAPLGGTQQVAGEPTNSGIILKTLEDKLKTKVNVFLARLASKLGMKVKVRVKLSDEYSEVYGVNAGKNVEIEVVGTESAPFTFDAGGADNVLNMAIDVGAEQSIVFGTGKQNIYQVLASIHSVFPGLATKEGLNWLKLTAKDSIDIKDTSTALAVLGLTSGATESNSVTIDAIITADKFTPMDSFSIGTLEEGILYDPSGTVNVGDVVEVLRADGRNRRFKVAEAPEAIGNTTTVLERFRISSVV